MAEDDWRAEYEARRIREEASARDSLKKACALLRRLGVNLVRLEYDGEDGAGDVYSASVEPELPGGVPFGVGDLICHGACWLLPPGWELDAGAFGGLTIDLNTFGVERDHHRRIHSTEHRTDRIDL